MDKKVSAIPNIDLGAHFKIIDESGIVPCWKTIGYGYATIKHARKLMKEHNLHGIWMFDDLGNKKYII